ncbi:UDP-N-acetylmuramate dehydrogenase [uncultured Marinobacter sp.]|uniref:UDP-N-acetylmuramate dehydrogenase n=1 Tax=uncultured Marinobacter sp. TaxID=187379 RepID=UPI0030D70835
MISPETLKKQVDLASLSTMATPARARYFLAATTVEQALAGLELAATEQWPLLILGGGSNLVFCDDFQGLVLHMAIRGRRWTAVDEQGATLVLAAGENWHDAVLYAARAGYRGIENLALIPGTAGAAPVQNIGAYGMELADTLVSVKVWDRELQQERLLKPEDCQFGYRDSLFKQQPGRYLILEIRLRLSRRGEYRTGYGELAQWFGGVQPRSPLEVTEAVMALRRRKLPDPQQLPNAGSFFKNPVVSEAVWQGLRQEWPDMVAFPAEDEQVKLAAGWLIERCGWKGYKNQTVGVHHKQALVLVNHSGGTGKEVMALASRIREEVHGTFGVTLEVEPGIVPEHCGLPPL